MPIHFAGDVATDIKEIREVADANDVFLFEDACHSPGATLDGMPAGSFGQSASFSFCFNKVVTTGEGGMVVTDSAELRDELRLFRSHGQDDNGEYVTYGHNFRLPTMAAALGVSQVNNLEYIIGRRREMAGFLNDELRDIDLVSVPEFPPERESVYQLYNLRFDDEATRDGLREHLDDLGVPTRITYDPVHLTRFYRDRGWTEGDLPVTEEVSNHILTLPFHLNLDDDDLTYIVDSVRSYFDGV
jgi:dTDP-4-amino-4,6-dideoxygalactose transaminase